MTRWTATDMPDQSGRTVVITGASSGLGKQTARALAAAGARVVLAVRSRERGEQARVAMAGQTEVRELDLTDLASVRRFVDAWSGPVDVLINNAGVMATRADRTADGFELQFGTNHLGHFALTNLLLPAVTDRVVTVSSLGHRMGELVLDDLNWERRPYAPWPAYGQSKLANLLFTLELQRRLDADRSGVRALATHPGLATSNLYRPGHPWAKRVGDLGIRVLGQSEEAGARSTLFAAVQDLPGASYVGPGGALEGRGSPRLVGRSASARDGRLAQELWRASEELTGVRYPTGLSEIFPNSSDRR